jgi:hypothetical protein
MQAGLILYCMSCTLNQSDDNPINNSFEQGTEIKKGKVKKEITLININMIRICVMGRCKEYRVSS